MKNTYTEWMFYMFYFFLKITGNVFNFGWPSISKITTALEGTTVARLPYIVNVDFSRSSQHFVLGEANRSPSFPHCAPNRDSAQHRDTQRLTVRRFNVFPLLVSFLSVRSRSSKQTRERECWRKSWQRPLALPRSSRALRCQVEGGSCRAVRVMKSS